MTFILIIFGALTLLTGIIIFLNPDIIFGYLKNHIDNLELYILAIVVRLVLGIILISLSAESRYPFVIELIGWLSIIAALFFTVIGHTKFKRIMSWALSLAKPFARAGGIVAVAFGAFIIYAFV
ncbi:MAG: hypothetical protein ACQ9ET_02055 [Nitrosomonadaceae bacterium]